MLKFTLCIVAGSLLALGFGATSAQAQTRVFVAAQGADGNPCTFALPCRTFQHAHNIVPAGGEIDVLDPAGYGALTISKAISIQGHGYAGISVAATSAVGITVNAGTSDAIHIGGVLIDGAGIGQTGIRFNTGAFLTVENCVVRRFTADGIAMLPTGSNAVRAIFNQVQLYDNGSSGLNVDTTSMGSGGTLDATARNSVSASNGFAGFVVFGAGARARLMVTGSAAVNNSTGLFSDRFAPANPVNLFVGQSVIAGNGTSWTALAPLSSYGDNDIDGNNDGDPAPPVISKK